MNLLSTLKHVALACAAFPLMNAAVAATPAWTQTGADVFKLPSGLYRSQGMTTDGSNWYFSWQYGLEKTDLTYNEITRNGTYAPFASGIPASLSALGYNHIGDIDTAGGIVYASLDSSTSGYNTPAVALYNATDLSYTGSYFTLTAPHGTHDIASWFAVDAAQGLAYGMAYNHATEMAVYDLATWSFVRYIGLKGTLDQVQGGKIAGDWMYMASDDATRSVYRTNLLTGDIETLFSVKQPYDQEVEGLAVTQGPGGVQVNVLVINDPNNSGQNVADPGLNVTLYHYAVAPVPEPASYALLMAGLGAIALAARRRRG